MLIVDAGALFEVLADTPRAEAVRSRMAADTDHAAPHLVDAEVLSVIRTCHRRGELDVTAASQAVDDLRSWPGTRFAHGPFVARAWELRANVRSYDALYVALAEAMGAPLLTLDERLARAPGLHCEIEVLMG